MNRSIIFRCVLSASCLLVASMNSQAQPLTSSQWVSGGTRCDHIIQMMLRHGVNNRFDRSATSSLLNHSPFGGIQVPVYDLGDLQIVQVTQLPPEVPVCGPKFAVVVMNQSNRSVCNFHVSAAAVFGHICPTSPNTTVEVAKMNAGETMEVMVSLPIEAYSMGNRNGEVLSFQKLIVAIDSFDELLETDEANNIRAFDATEIAVVTTVIQQTATAVIESSVTVPTAQLQIQGSPVVSAQNPFNRSNGEVSVDALDLDHPTPESLRTAIQQVSAPQPSVSQPGPSQPGPSQLGPSQNGPSQLAPSQPVVSNQH